MARLKGTGFELGSLLIEADAIIGVGNNVACDVSTTEKKTGSYALRVGNTSLFFQGHKSAVWVLPTSIAQFGLTFHFRYPSTVPLDVGGVWIMNIVDASDNILAGIIATPTSPYLNLMLNGSQVGDSFSVNYSTWYHIGININKHASAGWIGLYIDGNLVASTTGNTGATTIKKYRLGTYPQITGFNQTWGENVFLYWDDPTWDDLTGETSMHYISDRRWTYLPSNATGTYSEMSSYPSGTVNYTLVDEIPDDGDTTHVQALTSGLRDAYQVSDFTLPADMSIAALVPVANAKKLDGSQVQLQLGIWLGTTGTLSTAQDLTTSYYAYYSRFTGTLSNAEWTESDVNSVQIFLQSAGSYI